jgi:hypothetical protein
VSFLLSGVDEKRVGEISVSFSKGHKKSNDTARTLLSIPTHVPTGVPDHGHGRALVPFRPRTALRRLARSFVSTMQEITRVIDTSIPRLATTLATLLLSAVEFFRNTTIYNVIPNTS